MGHCAVFHEFAILNHLPISENICEFSKVRNRPVVYSRHKAGTSVYFGHISSSETIVVYDLKLATDDRSDKKFLLTSKHCPLQLGAICPLPGAICPLPLGYIHA